MLREDVLVINLYTFYFLLHAGEITRLLCRAGKGSCLYFHVCKSMDISNSVCKSKLVGYTGFPSGLVSARGTFLTWCVWNCIRHVVPFCFPHSPRPNYECQGLGIVPVSIASCIVSFPGGNGFKKVPGYSKPMLTYFSFLVVASFRFVCSLLIVCESIGYLDSILGSNVIWKPLEYAPIFVYIQKMCWVVWLIGDPELNVYSQDKLLHCSFCTHRTQKHFLFLVSCSFIWRSHSSMLSATPEMCL